MHLGRHATVVIVFSALVAAPVARAATGRELLDQAKRLDGTTRHWTDRTQKMALLIYDASGNERRREIQILTKRYPGNEQKTISFFSAPPEVRGTAFLQWEHQGRDADQWLYLPEFKRTRQIVMHLRDESFVATDFTYRDLEIIGHFLQWTEAEASATLLADERVDGTACHVIELHPQQEGSPYSRLQLWLETEKLIPRKLQFTDRDGAAVKVLSFDDVRDVGSFPTPYRLEMRTLKKGSRTVVEVREAQYDTGLSDELFAERYLVRGAP